MEQLIARYEQKLIAAGLAQPGAPLFGAQDDVLVWNREGKEIPVLRKVFENLGGAALLYTIPAQPYRTVFEHLAAHAGESFRPRDSETRTFLHDFPVVRSFDADSLTAALQRRKCAIIQGGGVIARGAISPEQAFVGLSSACFACTVKFLADALAEHRAGYLDSSTRTLVASVLNMIPDYPPFDHALMHGPFDNEADIYRALAEAGRKVVGCGLVDSYFGNISYRRGHTLFISQTGSSLDELDGCIDPCSLNNDSCAAITASSELSAHKRIAATSGQRAILHGHPLFAVILSLDCTHQCDLTNRCHIECPYPRFIDEIPIVPGEVGTGPYGLCNTVPPAMKGREGVIVFGHGVFTAGADDFNEAFSRLLTIEADCRAAFRTRIGIA
jgi:ribulose-5-phosphate 4-epimerase/fuculose-1-phosphate aldolase